MGNECSFSQIISVHFTLTTKESTIPSRGVNQCMKSSCKKKNNKFLSLGDSWLVLNKELKQHRRRRRRKRLLKSEVALLQTLSHLFHVVQSVKCWHFFLELNSKRLYRSSGKEKESRCVQVLHIFTSYSCIDGKEIYKKA